MRIFSALASFFLSYAALGVTARPALSQTAPPVASLLATGHADQALAAIRAELSANPNDAQALNLECRVLYSEELINQALPRCQRAVELEPGDGSYHLWLGRALGRKAEHTAKLKALGVAKQVRTEFEAAHRLEPRNGDAASDLAEYYVKAPEIAGGGRGKAEALAAEVEPWSPELAHSIRAGIAQKAKDAAGEERELLLAVGSPARPAALVDLAGFYRAENRTADMLAVLDKAVAADAAQDAAMVSASELLTASGERPQQAIALLRAYLGSSRQTEDAPAFCVHAQLSGLLGAAGDPTGAQAELASARMLASGWQPVATGSGAASGSPSE